MSGHDADEELLGLVEAIACKVSRAAVSDFGVGGPIFASAASRLQRALDRESPHTSHRAAVALLAICQTLRTVTDHAVAPSPWRLRKAC